jgi:hypothetical protein
MVCDNIFVLSIFGEIDIFQKSTILCLFLARCFNQSFFSFKTKENTVEEMDKTFSLLDMLKEETEFEKNTQTSNPKKSKEKQTGKVNEDSLSFLDFLKAEEEKLPKKSEKSGKRKLSGEDDLLSLFDILKTEEPKTEKKPKPKPEKNKKIEDGEMLSLFDILKVENEPTSKKKNSKKIAPKKQLTSETVSNATKSLNKVKKQEKSDKTDEELSLSDFLKNAEKTPKPKESFFKRRTSKKDIKEPEPEDTGDMFSLMDILKTEKVEDKKKRKESFSSSFFVRTKTIGTNNHNDSMILGKKTKSWGSIRQEKPLERKNSQSKKETPTVIKPEEEIPVTPRTKRNSIKLTNFIFKDEEPGTTPVVPSTPRTKRNSIKLTNFVLKDEEPGTAPVVPSTPRSKRNSIRLPNFVFKERDESPEPSGLLSPTGTIERKKHETLISVFGAKKKESKMDLNVSGSNSTPTLATSEDSETDSNSTHKDDHEEEIKKKILGSRSNCLYIFNTKLLLKCFHLNFVLLIQYVPNTSKIV